MYFQTNGTQTAPITITNYPGENPLISGNAFAVPNDATESLIHVTGAWYKISNINITRSGGAGLQIDGDRFIATNIYSYQNWGSGIIVTGSYGLVENSRIWNNVLENERMSYPLPYGWGFGMSACRYGNQYNVFRGNKVWDNWGEGISTFESYHTTIEDNVSYNNIQNLYISDTQYTVAQRNLVYCTVGNPIESYTTQNGILVGDESHNPASANNTIINNFVSGCQRNLAIGAAEMANGLVANNTFVNARYIGAEPANVLFYAGSVSNGRFENNIIEQDDSAPICQMEASGVTLTTNAWSRTTASNCGTASDVISNPQLAKTGSTTAGSLSPDWFRLLAGSPAINKAMPLSQVTTDFFNATRGQSPDIGGAEYGATSGTGSGADTTPPGTPTGVAAIAVSSSQINVSWTASTDNVGVVGYRVFRNGSLAGTTSTTTYQSTGLTASTTYSYTVQAYDAAGNSSAESTAVSATTQTAAPAPDTTAPSTPTGVAAVSVSTSQINVSWTASTDNVGVVGYRVFRNGSLAGTTSTTTYQSTGLSAGTTYSYTVQAYDAAGNSSAQSAVVTATTQVPPPVASGPITITITSPSGSTVVRNTVVTLGATAQGVTPVSITWSVDGVSIAGTTTQTATGATSTAAWSVGNGRGWHTITATATDAAGRTVTGSLRVRGQ